ncbi:Heparan sulfate glucosamine 3-O-sulfotransferase 3B1 [Hondaea fermentalgiana]|uniref:Heparan sulfate glucosamine 3-O-sulfotransferase 3B1 n=1 Tax=Hondaea fermentalgiana TaxID=2315210 RepID=A0A2R5GNQ6_9STRA|nr:Heparan sulfate glucosamine 3-O-sulfotransferase 3B1 [Hondaea fermentalgiana]|eukprot:GBG32255.1 Heparan sulfate glucosamine 3-O-sulfotransferase 3B1 [Hondaea fermentalgiana]
MKRHPWHSSDDYSPGSLVRENDGFASGAVFVQTLDSELDGDLDDNFTRVRRGQLGPQYDEFDFRVNMTRMIKPAADDSECATTWASISENFIYPESNEAALYSGIPHPYSPDHCFELCGEVVCEKDMAERTDFTTRKNPSYSRPRCKERHNIPAYFIIGYSQSGTTFFSDVIRKHNDVRAACHKEIHYFDVTLYLRAQYHKNRVDKPRSITSYFGCFRRVNFDQKKIIGDHTVKAIYTDIWYPSWVRAINQRMKLIVLLRDPTKRTYSRFSQMGGGRGCPRFIRREFCRDMLPYVTTMLRYIKMKCPGLQPGGDPSHAYRCGYHYGTELLDNDTIISGLYELHVRHWLNFFPPEQFLFISSDMLFKSPEEAMSRATDFLELPPYEPGAIQKYISEIGPHTHTRNKAPPHPEAMEMLRQFYAPYNDELRKLLISVFHIPEEEITF